MSEQSKDIVQRLRVKINCEETLQKWDMIRDYLLKGNLGSYAREAFESFLDFADEEREEAADLIEAQAAEIGRLKHIAEHRHPTMDDLLNERLKTKAAEAEVKRRDEETPLEVQAARDCEKWERERADKAEAQASRMREALEKIELLEQDHWSDDAASICRKALEENP